MSQSRTVLLASFIDRKDLDTAIQKIKENFVIVGSKIFILRNKNEDDKLIITYNIQVDEGRVQFDRHIPGTVNLHRKKETNTLYTLNALNEIVKTENGKPDKQYQINWVSYMNCILITQRSKGLIRIETELEKILNLENVKVK